MKTVLAAALAACALPSLALAADAEHRIAARFGQLGMPEQQAQCYGRVLAQRLGPDEGAEAAAMLEKARNGDDVRYAVKEARGPLMAAFMAASRLCGGS